MADKKLTIGAKVSIKKKQLNELISSLQKLGYQTIGPKVRDGAIIYDTIRSLDDFPQGYTNEQERGHYRLKLGNHERYFDITLGPDSWKKYLFPPRTELFQVSRQNGRWSAVLPAKEQPKLAFIGVRPCELAAIGIQDKVFIRDDFVDPIYYNRRVNVLTIVVNCLHPSRTCFCTSMQTGPKAEMGFDLSLTELEEVFLVDIGSDAGLALMQPLNWEPASAYDLQIEEDELIKARNSISRRIENLHLVPDMLLDNLEHSRWDEVATRCLSCTSCTQVCPTCFCWDVEDNTDLSGDNSKRERVWDSCFNLSYSAQAGGNTRPTTKSRYRQWLTHKMGSWVKQFGESGCVGCGRCITWCPAKIDITEEIKQMQDEVA